MASQRSVAHSFSLTLSFFVCPRIISAHCLNSFACQAHLCGAPVTLALLVQLLLANRAMYLCAAYIVSYATTENI